MACGSEFFGDYRRSWLLGIWYVWQSVECSHVQVLVGAALVDLGSSGPCGRSCAGDLPVVVGDC